MLPLVCDIIATILNKIIKWHKASTECFYRLFLKRWHFHPATEAWLCWNKFTLQWLLALSLRQPRSISDSWLPKLFNFWQSHLLLHCSIFPVPASKSSTVREWIFLQGQRVFATKSVSDSQNVKVFVLSSITPQNLSSYCISFLEHFSTLLYTIFCTALLQCNL